jgi:hypothetical protein
MPEKIWIYSINWIKSVNIQVTDDLAAKNKKDLGNENILYDLDYETCIKVAPRSKS